MPKGPIIHSILSPLIFFILLFVYIKLAGPIPFNVSNVNTNVSDTFNVTGEGKSQITPNEAVVRAGVTAKGPTAQAAKDQMNSAINKVSDSIQSLGIPKSDIQTENFNINPEYDYSGGTQKITGYAGNTNLNITVKNINQVNSVIDTATQNGANVVDGANFKNSNDTKAMDEARAKAVADARKKAQNISKIAGFKLGRVVNYSENNGGLGKVFPMAAGGAADRLNVPTQVEPGTNEVNITVTLSYEIN